MPTDKDFEDYDLDEKAVVTCDEVYCEKETDLALLIVFDTNDDGSQDSTWIPKSCVHDDSEVYQENQAGLLVVKRWKAEKEGWA